MSPRGETPQSEHRRLRVALRDARDALHLTQKEVADALEWSSSKIIRIESGSVGISVTDLKALLLHYRVTDANEVDRMVTMARASKKAAWWQEHRELLTQDFITFLGLEASAVRMKQFQGLLFPGLLQSRSYIKALLALGDNTPEQERRGVEVRLKRQELISDHGPEISFIIDESVLYRKVGDAAAMREQLEKVKEVAEHPRVSIRVMPFAAGVHKGMKSSFEILELSDEPGDYALLLEQPYKDQLFQVVNDETKEFVDIFSELEKIALPATETPRMIDERLKEMGRER